MAFGFGSSSSSSSSSSQSNGAPPAPTREERKACWSARDAYYDCLTKNNVIKPGDEQKGADGQPLKGGGNVCKVERLLYEKDCSHSWIDYFNQRRVLEFRQRAQLEKAAEQGVPVPPFKR